MKCLIIGRTKEYSKYISINELVSAKDSIINFYLDHSVFRTLDLNYGV